MGERRLINEQRPRCRFCGELAEDCNLECDESEKAMSKLISTEVVKWPEWKSLAKRLGIPELPMRVVLTLEMRSPVVISVDYMAVQPPDEQSEPTSATSS
jgi:hypothetical protein